ncbi:MAG: dNTP triphosphohydrolase [Flavobacteriaceae bacterium]|jgi:dGTPase|nr:dNTP triphosphohydrolase [Pelagibacterales bacterium]MBT4709384.1 dNTP triphosphohydrolase [Flavobacteriaceae bacterium]MBT4958835.1 dNTP triphosphohydrolase [Flavobacteriaceae bacterium]MDG1830848.1 dNTP triphosphohydrolase [Flavobacteriaceae bacterium]
MNWEQLLSLKRQGDTLKRLRLEQDETRIGFEVDYDRIIFSSSFRSLQDKTQVIPFSKKSFVHTRLTHSLEVSVVGRSLGRKTGKIIIEKYPHLKETYGFQSNDFGAIVAAASLAHDIGNPPFGHSGEMAIGDYFKNGNGSNFKNQLNPQQYQDLCDFEGNANGFKIVSENKTGIPGGLRLSYATLGAFTKYPKGSIPIKPSLHIKDKKFGFFESQNEFFNNVALELGLNQSNGNFFRHPLAFLVEAADDICYTLIDFEDGINLGWISEEFALEYLIRLVKGSIDTKKYNALEHKSDRVAYLRALSVNTLINDAVDIFIKNEEALLNGEYPKSILENSVFKAQMKDIIDISIEKVYKSEEVIEKELKGYQVIHHLLNVFVKAAVNNQQNKTTAFDELALACIPKSYIHKEGDLYTQLLDISCFIASLTDGKALEWYKKMS